MAERILVVDDDRQLISFLERFLAKQGFAVASAGTATQMAQMLEQRGFDLVVLDIGLPDRDGFEVMRELRRTSRMPIIVLTARDEVFDRVVGLELGADDYLTKPFEPRELLARIRSVLRRTSPAEVTQTALLPAERLNFAGYVLDLMAGRLARGDGGAQVPLTSTEFTLLRALAERPGEVLSRDSIMTLVYGNSTRITDRAIDAHVARIRRKIDGADSDGSLIRTVHGVGYALAVAVQPA